MSERNFPGKAELLTTIDAGWNDFQNYLDGFTEEQLTTPTDALGWTAKDHLTHLADWEDGIWAMLNYKPRHEYMGMSWEMWLAEDYKSMNAIIRERRKDMSLSEVRDWFRSVHERHVEKVSSMSEEELMRPYSHYLPDEKLDAPVMYWVMLDTYEHYDIHKAQISKIFEG